MRSVCMDTLYSVVCLKGYPWCSPPPRSVWPWPLMAVSFVVLSSLVSFSFISSILKEIAICKIFSLNIVINFPCIKVYINSVVCFKRILQLFKMMWQCWWLQSQSWCHWRYQRWWCFLLDRMLFVCVCGKTGMIIHRQFDKNDKI